MKCSIYFLCLDYYLLYFEEAKGKWLKFQTGIYGYISMLHFVDLIYSLQSKAEIASNCQYLMNNNNFITRYVVFNFSLQWLVLCYRWKQNSWACCRQCRWLSFDEWLVKCWNKWKWSYRVFLRIGCKVRTNELFQLLFFFPIFLFW